VQLRQCNAISQQQPSRQSPCRCLLLSMLPLCARKVIFGHSAYPHVPGVSPFALSFETLHLLLLPLYTPLALLSLLCPIVTALLEQSPYFTTQIPLAVHTPLALLSPHALLPPNISSQSPYHHNHTPLVPLCTHNTSMVKLPTLSNKVVQTSSETTCEGHVRSAVDECEKNSLCVCRERKIRLSEW
jgi:hypothetical protein